MNGQERETSYNSTYPKGGVSCSADTFVQAESSVLRMKFSGKSPALRVASNRYVKLMKNIFLLLFILLFIQCKERGEKIHSYHANGQAEWKLIYPNMEDTSTYELISYYDNGKIRCSKNIVEGQENGKFANYYSSGNVECKGFVKNGEFDGMKFQYYENGNILSICSYIMGLKQDTSKYFYKNGRLNAIGLYVNDERNGLWRIYSMNSYKEVNYLKGKREGKTKEILEDSCHVYGQYKNDKEDGKWIWKVGDTLLRQVAFYENGKYEGESIYYHKNGNPEKIAKMSNDCFNGEMKVFDENGKLIRIDILLNDTLISSRFVK